MSSDRQRAIQEAAALLRAGALAVIPTDTVYGLAAHVGRQAAVDALFEAKARAGDKPIPVLAATLEDVAKVAVVDERARSLARRFWPGALTLVLRRAQGFRTRLTTGGDDDTVAVRVPDDRVARALLSLTGPLAVTSANVSGDSPVRTAEDARLLFRERVAVYLDDGPRAGAPSTVVSLVDDLVVLRTGGVTRSDLEEALP